MKLILFVLFFCLLDTTYGQDTSFIRKREYKKIKISLSDVQKLISTLEYYNNQVPKDTSDKYDNPRIKLEISKDDKALSLTTFQQISNLKLDDDKFTNLFFSYIWDKKPISDLTIQFNNSFRILSISGTDERKVDAAYQEMNKVISKNISSFAWINWSFVLYLIAIIIVSFITQIILKKIMYSKGIEVENASLMSISFTLSSIVVMFVFIFMPINFSELFPKFVLTSNDVNWIDRNVNLMGFIGLLISLFTPVYKFALWLIKANKKEIKKIAKEE